MRIWKEQFLKLSGGFPDLFIDYFYITGDDAFPDDYATDAGNRVKQKAKYHNSKAKCVFHYIGAKELWELVQRRPPTVRALIWSETPMSATEGTVWLVKLKDFYDFLQDEPGVLAEQIFESNVRGYQRDVVVNQQIQTSLQSNPNGINFWVLNNGITIITSNSTPAGHLRASIQDPQIVNGLQTSREIFNYFSGLTDSNDNRSVLVRVIETSNPSVRDEIIKATNSQNKMMPSQLRMTDQIHRDIEELFKKAGLFYDRRKGYYRDQGKPIRKIISVNALTQAAISLLLQRPNDARARPGDYFKNDERYNTIFGPGQFPLPVYLTCVQLVELVDRYLLQRGVERGDVKNLKFYVAALVVREIAKMAHPPVAKLLPIDIAKIDSATIQSAYKKVLRSYNSLSKQTDRDTVARGTELLRRLNRQSKSRFGKKKKSKAKGK